MALLKKKDILNANYKQKDVYIKELDGEVRIRELAIGDQLEFEAKYTGKNSEQVVYGLILNCCIDENGEKLFEESDLVSLKKQSASIIIELLQEILALNSMTEEEIDSIAKN